jgi:hypothetical protein
MSPLVLKVWTNPLAFRKGRRFGSTRLCKSCAAMLMATAPDNPSIAPAMSQYRWGFILSLMVPPPSCEERAANVTLAGPFQNEGWNNVDIQPRIQDRNTCGSTAEWFKPEE